MEEPIIKVQEFYVKQWIDVDGKEIEPLKFSDFKEKFKVVYCFQSWCPGCHSRGFPDLKKMVNALKGNDKVSFFAVQTVFEGHTENTFDKIMKTQKQYGLKIPFGHDAGDDGKSRSNIMINFKTGGTPWFLFIDKHNSIVYSDFHLNPEAAIDFLKTL